MEVSYILVGRVYDSFVEIVKSFVERFECLIFKRKLVIWRKLPSTLLSKELNSSKRFQPFQKSTNSL
jgi:hypothetical protein